MGKKCLGLQSCPIFSRFFLDCFLHPLACGLTHLSMSGVGTRQVQANFGDMGSGSLATSLNVKYLNTLTNLCIVRAARDNYQLALASASLVRTGTSVEMRIRDAVSIIATDQAREAIRIF